MRIKRVYEPREQGDGKRILVDRLWPRGLSKKAAAVDVWLREVAPSPELRRWFDHDPAKWVEFQRRYEAELEQNASAVEGLMDQIDPPNTTLLYAARDQHHNHALVLLNLIRRRLEPGAA